jgi:crossover junction endodeoxyribonuclease RuvC
MDTICEYMIILGFDPGYARIGWGIIRKTGSHVEADDFGCIESDKSLPDEKRLAQNYSKINKLYKTFSPDVVAVETLYFTTNAKTALAVGQGRGIILLSAGLNNIPLFSYTPLQVKTAITGYGKADKQQIQRMVQSLLSLKTIPEPDDAADALAIALTHAFTKRYD